jgi:hypothetical protein
VAVGNGAGRLAGSGDGEGGDEAEVAVRRVVGFVEAFAAGFTVGLEADLLMGFEGADSISSAAGRERVARGIVAAVAS